MVEIFSTVLQLGHEWCVLNRKHYKNTVWILNVQMIYVPLYLHSTLIVEYTRSLANNRYGSFMFIVYICIFFQVYILVYLLMFLYLHCLGLCFLTISHQK